MKKSIVVLCTFLSSLTAFAWEVEPPPPGTCTRVVQLDQTWDYLVLNGQIRIIKSKVNNDYLSAALLDQSLVVCLGGDPDLWGNVDVVSIGRPTATRTRVLVR